MNPNRPLSRREGCALFFAAALVTARDSDTRDIPQALLHRELMRDAFAYADSFLDAVEDQQPVVTPS